MELILGTAGHIDHGKTSLVAALTGTNTDRLPEEKKRGITIELGYAELDLDPYHFGIVDVPGHEKFVRQMVSGASGMDLVILVIAADDSIKPQTREHVDILRFLNLPAGVIALTKCDLVEADWLDMVEEEVRGFVDGTFLAAAPIVRTSSTSGLGLEALKVALRQAAGRAYEHRQQMAAVPFRLPIDRCFPIEGHGTVVTGSVASGSVDVGDLFELQPGGRQVRVRSLNNHTRPSEQLQRGQRAAINLAGVHHGDVQRGQELAAIGYLVPTTCCNVELMMLPKARPLKNRATVRFHIGTAELMGHIRFADREQLEAGETDAAQLVLAEPCVAVWGQPFVLRSESPVATIGGGRIIDPLAIGLRRGAADLAHWLRQQASHEPKLRIAAHARLHTDLEAATKTWEPASLARNVGVVETADVVQQLVDEGQLVQIQATANSQVWVHQESLEKLADNLKRKLDQMHTQQPLRWSFPLVELKSFFGYLEQSQWLDVALQQLKSRQEIRWEQGKVGLVGRGPQLSKNDRLAMQDLVQRVRQGGKTPPLVKQLSAAMPKLKDRCGELLELADAAGDLVKINHELFFDAQLLQAMKLQLAEQIGPEGMTVSDIKQLLDISRKYAVPLCEHLDATGFTNRKGDLRFVAESKA